MSTTAMTPAPATAPAAVSPAPTPHPSPPQPDLSAIERVVMMGDLSRLTQDERMLFVRQLCESLGLNPLTQPLIYLPDRRGKLGIYPTKDCAAQLRRNHNISLEILAQEIASDVLTVRVRASMPGSKGTPKRTDDDLGAVSIRGLSPEDMANAAMKAATKAKRRATLSICGLGFLDPEENVERTVDVQTVPRNDSAWPPAHLDLPPGPPASDLPTLPDRRNAAAVGAAAESLTVDLPANKRASEDQIARLAQLKLDLDIDRDTWRGKILAKRNVTTARDLSPEQATELIERLRTMLAAKAVEAAPQTAQTTDIGKEAGAGAPNNFRPDDTGRDVIPF